jgi:hypothetical protein
MNDRMMLISDWIIAMNDTIASFEESDEAALNFDVSDAALEAAANPGMAAAFSFPNAPTVSILVYCCGDQVNAAPAERNAAGQDAA